MIDGLDVIHHNSLNRSIKRPNVPIVETLKRRRKELPKRRFICAIAVCMVVLLSGYFHSYIGSLSTKQVSLVFFYLSAGIMVAQWGWFFAKNIFLITRMRMLKGKTISWTEMPEFEELAKEMKVKLHRKQPFGIMPDFDNAFTNPNTRQIIFGKDLVDRLQKLEHLALAVHELTHLKENHLMKQFIIPLVPLILVSLTIPEEPYSISVPLYLAAFLMFFAYIGRRNEYIADDSSAARTSNEVVISLLKKSTPPDQWSHESQVHPSTDQRISRLSKK